MKNKWAIAGIIVVAALLIATAAGIWGNGVAVSAQGTVARTPTPVATVAAATTGSLAAAAPVAQDDVVAALESTLIHIYGAVSPSVVHIEVRQTASLSLQGFPFGDYGQAPDQYSYGSGSGFVWDTEGHIVTNNHVVENADQIRVRFHDGTIVEATVVGTDPDSDLAVIQVDAPAALLQPVTMGDSTTVKVGQLAVAIGNPFDLENSMTVGFVSALGRSLSVSNDNPFSTSSYSIPDIIQTDAPINPGNSGGVLVDRNGRVIGVTSAIISPVEASVGIGFAVPAAIVATRVPVLIETGQYIDPWIGITGTTLTPDLAEAMDLDANQRGALVTEVTPGSPAEAAGLRPGTDEVTIQGQDVTVGGDVIVAINGEPVRVFDDLVAYLARHTVVGDEIILTVLRDGKTVDVSVTLGARPTEAGQSAETTEAAAYLGITGLTVEPAIAEAMGLDSDQTGVLIEEVASGSPADEAGLRGSFRPVEVDGQRILIGGDVIVAWEGKAITSTDDLQQALAQVQPGDRITLSILRGGRQRDVTVTLGERPNS